MTNCSEEDLKVYHYLHMQAANEDEENEIKEEALQKLNEVNPDEVFQNLPFEMQSVANVQFKTMVQ